MGKWQELNIEEKIVRILSKSQTLLQTIILGVRF